MFALEIKSILILALKLLEVFKTKLFSIYGHFTLIQYSLHSFII
jgi:hypothetical protein